MKKVSLSIAPFALPLAILHLVILVIAASHPLLAFLLTFLSTGCSLSILSIWTWILGKPWLRKQWKKIETIKRNRLWVRLRKQARKKAANSAPVPVEQLRPIVSDIQRLGLAFHGTTPELEQARRAHFHMIGEPLPRLVLPAKHTTLYAEFKNLVRMLNNLGFPYVEHVQIQQKDLAFIQQWGSDLEARLLELQKQAPEQQDASRPS